MGINNLVLKTVLQLQGNSEHLHPYHLLFGYAKLLSVNESTLRVMLDNEECLQDLEKGRNFFKEKQLDVKLVKIGMPMLIQLVEKDSQQQSVFEQMQQFISQDKEMTSYEILSTILQEQDDIFNVFRNGHTIDDVFEYQGKLKKQIVVEKPKEKPKKEEVAITIEIPQENKQPEVKTGKELFLEVSETYRKLRIDLLDVVKGQNEAVLEFVQGCYQGSVLKDTGKRKLPKATFLFLGPPGVGKTLLAQTASESLGYPTKTFNMSEYSAHQSHEGLIGVSSFYKDAEEGVLVKFVRENPKCILVFDEIEKAHKNVIQLFLQMLDLGTLDNTFKKEKTSFKDAIIIFTSNACKSIYENNYGNIARTPKSVILETLKTETYPASDELIFPSAICSRIASGNLVMFNHLRVNDMVQMIQDGFDKTAKQIKNDYGYDVTYDSKLPLLFLFHHGVNMDARIATRQSDKFIKNELFELSRQLESHPQLLDSVESLRFDLDIASKDISDEIKDLFVIRQDIEIAIVCKEEDRHYFNMPEPYKIYFADDLEQLKSLLKYDLTLVLIDLYHGLKEDINRGISLDDFDSVGVKTFDYLEANEGSIPLYLFESSQSLNVTDSNTYFRKGAMGIISAVNASNESIHRQLEEIVKAIYMEQKGKELSKRGYVLAFNTAQRVDQQMVKIVYHDLKKQQALSNESAVMLLSDVERPNVCFDDVIGAENAKGELQEFIKYLSNPRKFVLNGGKPAKGVLLYGPPGTGKTMLARAMAGESNVSFLQVSATEFMNKWFGQSEQNVRNLFKRAKQHAPSIIFIDEIDAIGKTRTGENPHSESVLNTLLTEMDGFKVDVKNPVFVLAATNYKIEGNGAMSLDPALVRRFDNRICVDLPNEKERYTYLQRMINKKGFYAISQAAIENVATRTPGLSLAVLQNVLDLAYRNAQKQHRLPNGDDLQNALEEYNYGEKHEWKESYYHSVAIHESGHAYMAYLANEKPSYLTIVSRGNFGGYMAHENNEDKPNYTKEELRWRIRCALAGRAAEEIFFGKEASLNTGASSDLQHATQYALHMLCEYGMMEGQFISIPLQTLMQTPLITNYLQQANALLQQEMNETIALMQKGKHHVERLANELMKKNHLTKDEIIAVLEENKSI